MFRSALEWPARIALAVTLIALAACMPRPEPLADASQPYAHLAQQDAALSHLPPFTRAPIMRGGAPVFTRAAVLAIARREWDLFGRQQASFLEPVLEDADQHEAGEGYWQRIGEYWWLGLPAHERRRRSTGTHDSDGHEAASPEARDPWSAAFIAYVMRMAGARERFPYSGAHRVYITEATRNVHRQCRDALLIAHAPDAYAPKPGDLVCYTRGNASAITLAMLPDRVPPELVNRWESHCDLVAAMDRTHLVLLGGNVANAVAVRSAPIDADGRLLCQLADECPAPGLRWLTVIEVRYADE
jgi:Uncharacterized protein conserved in bacteria (DUF2272)